MNYLLIFICYCVVFAVMAIVNALNETRIPKSFWELLKFTFPPYFLIYRKQIRYENESR